MYSIYHVCFSSGPRPRYTQLCAIHIAKRKKLMDQSVRAGKDKEVAEMESTNHATY